MIKKDYSIVFYSPGTFVPETNTVQVEKWQQTVPHAVGLSKDIVQRYNARPHCFMFRTTTYQETVCEGEVCTSEPKYEESGFYHLDGKVLTLEDIPDTEKNHILRSNMKCNDIPAVVQTTNSYRHTTQLRKDDFVLQGTEIIAKGKDYY